MPSREDASKDAAKIAAKLGQAAKNGDEKRAAELADRAALARHLLKGEHEER